MALSIFGVDSLLRLSGAGEEILPLARNYLASSLSEALWRLWDGINSSSGHAGPAICDGDTDTRRIANIL